MRISNPFLPGTLSYLLFNKIAEFQGKSPPLVKTIFNQIGQTAGGAELANHILQRDSWLYEEIDEPTRERKIRLNHRIRIRRQIDMQKYEAQLENTRRHIESRKERENGLYL